MGMGLPSTAAYVIAATIGVTPLVNIGIPLLSANFFVFYFAIISFITPPVAVAAYAAAGIASSSTMKTGVQAFLLGISGFIIPYVCVYNPALLLGTSGIASTLYVTVLTLFAIFLLSSALTGYLGGRIHVLLRILSIISAVLIFVQGYAIIDYIGIALGILSIVLIVVSNKRQKRSIDPSHP